MDTKEFVDELNKIQELMQQENYKEAINLLEQLKEIEKEGNFNYNLTHKLYQLDSNTRSLYNQQKILKLLYQISDQNDSISFKELHQKLSDEEDINLDGAILRREIEILILRGLVAVEIKEDNLFFMKR